MSLAPGLRNTLSPRLRSGPPSPPFAACDPGGVSKPEYVRPRSAHDTPVRLSEPDPSWAHQYAAVAARIHAALRAGAQAATSWSVEHVGSTAVPGLAAKPVIDVVLLVPDSADEAAYVPSLEQAGFLLLLREPSWHEHRLLTDVDPAVNLHVFTQGSAEAARMLRFRDRLRADPEARATYERTKRALAQQRWQHVQDYADAKTTVVEAILDG